MLTQTNGLNHSCELDDTLPNIPLFIRLLGFAHRLPPSQVAVQDNTSGKCASHLQLLNDVLSLRRYLYSLLDIETRMKLERKEEVFMLLLAPPGYEYAVGFLAILALGAAVVPISTHVPLKEALYYAEKSTSRGLVFHPKYTDLSVAIGKKINSSTFMSASITALSSTALTADQIYISSTHSLDPNRAGLVIFTSGTTGPPKAVVLPREMLSSGAQALADHYEITPSDTLLHTMPVHHIAGIVVCFIPFLLAGSAVVFEPFNVQHIWENWKTGRFTVFGGVVGRPQLFTKVY
jgi:malonyl-CoA/methylmalonyl-CoA synthetase